MSETFIVDCPCCKAQIEVDKRTGKVVKHWEKKQAKEGVDPMQEALLKIQEDKKRLDAYFNGAGRSLEDKKKELEQKFEQEKKKIEESGDTSRPINPLDLD